ncbi:MAG: hypothetical protein WCQ23_05915 [Candidatus Methanomethylophilaceae archaeon]
MSTDSITIRERLLLHLSRFPEYDPSEIYNIPFDLTQDGIASVLGISRAHASLELKKLRESDKVGEWLAHIKLSGSKRKAYYLLEDGIREADLLKKRFLSDGISIETLLDMKRCDPNLMWGTLNDADRETFGLACTFREPIIRTTIPNTTTGIIPTDHEGYVRISEDVRKKYLDVADEARIKEWHSRAADWYVDNGGDIQERLYHLSCSGRDSESAKFLIKNADRFLENPNEDLLDIISKMKVPPKYNENILSIRAKIATHCGNIEDMIFCSDRLAEYRSPEAVIVRAEADILSGNAEKAYKDAFAAYNEKHSPGLALVTAKALLSLGRSEEAEKFVSEAVKTFMDSGDVSRADEIMVMKAYAAYSRGKNDECLSYLNKALRSCKKDAYRAQINDLISKVREGKANIRFF